MGTGFCHGEVVEDARVEGGFVGEGPWALVDVDVIEFCPILDEVGCDVGVITTFVLVLS